jgi:hypothetical protein
MLVGIVLGILIGAISGTVFLLLLRSANLPTTPVEKLVTLTGELLAIPTFWLGGPWVSTKLLAQIALTDILNPYLVSLASCFFLFCSYPAFRWTASLAAAVFTRRNHYASCSK